MGEPVKEKDGERKREKEKEKEKNTEESPRWIRDRSEPTQHNLHIGYILNIHDPLNYDIGLHLPAIPKYKNVISKTYHYKTDPLGMEKKGIAYRVRLHNIGVKKDDPGKVVKMKRAYRDIVRQLDRQNGLVICQIIGIDRYNRLIAELYDPLTLENMNQILLSPEKFNWSGRARNPDQYFYLYFDTTNNSQSPTT